ncbi:MAG: TonB-dependent receptor [Pseudomonadales bacterium]
MKNYSHKFALSAMVLSLTAAQVGQSQMLEEVVVTATKRAESLQDVPISMIAMGGESIRELGITKAEDFTANMPAITIAQNPIGNFVFIRGLGSAGANQGIEQSVSIFHDGVYMGRHQLSRAPFMDLDRVEVLRGPQSILFGKNTIGGAVHVISAKPTDEFEGLVTGLYGWEDDEKEVNLVLSGPFTDRLRGRLAVRSYQMDGYLENEITGQDGPERDDLTVRGQLAFDVTDNIDATVRFERSEFEQVQQTTQLRVTNPLGAGAINTSGLNQALVAAATGGDGTEEYDDRRAVDNDGGVLLGTLLPQFAGVPGFPDKPEGSDNEMDLASFTVNWGIGEHTLTAITGYAHYEYRDICDCDFAAIPLIEVDATEDYDQFSQEIRLASPGGEKIDYIVGAYYHKTDLTYRSVEAFGTNLLAPAGLPSALFPNVTRDYDFNQDQEQWAVFGSATFTLTDTLRSTIGLRYSQETKDVDRGLDKLFTDGWDFSALANLPAGTLAFGNTAADYDAFVGTAPLAAAVGVAETNIFADALGTFEHEISDDRDEDFISWSVNLEYDVSDNTMLFASVSTGVKGGGFDARFLKNPSIPAIGFDKFQYEEEKAINYELGVKATLLDGGMTLNATVFQTDIEDYQVSIFDGATAFFVDNVADIQARGVEVDMRWAATEQLIVSLAGSYLDNEYTEFPTAPCWARQTNGDNPIEGCITDPDTGVQGRDASGDPNSFSPEFAFNLNLDYSTAITDTLELRAVLNFNYSDEYFVAADLDPVAAFQESFFKTDARLSVGALDGAWEVSLLGKNLSDEMSGGNSNDQPLVPGNGFASTDRLRYYAVQGTYRF